MRPRTFLYFNLFLLSALVLPALWEVMITSNSFFESMFGTLADRRYFGVLLLVFVVGNLIILFRRAHKEKQALSKDEYAATTTAAFMGVAPLYIHFVWIISGGIVDRIWQIQNPGADPTLSETSLYSILLLPLSIAATGVAIVFAQLSKENFKKSSFRKKAVRVLWFVYLLPLLFILSAFF